MWQMHQMCNPSSSLFYLSCLAGPRGLSTSRASSHGEATGSHTRGGPWNMLSSGGERWQLKQTRASISNYTQLLFPAIRELHHSPCLAYPPALGPSPRPRSSHTPYQILLPEEPCFREEVTRKMQHILMEF